MVRVNIPFFFFSGEIAPERLAWVRSCLMLPGDPEMAAGAYGHGSYPEIRLFLTGDALMSLADARTAPGWSALASDRRVAIFADREELRLHGLVHLVSSRFPGIIVAGNGSPLEGGSVPEGVGFWQALVQALPDGGMHAGKAAFLLCHSPYMSRTPVYMLRFLKSAVEAGLTPELYSYLDGVHAAHRDQRPSEFENIGEGILALSTVAAGSGEDPWFGACSRCATARGYYVKNARTGGCEPASYLDAVTIRPLKEILDRFTSDHPILGHTCAVAPARCNPGTGTRGIPPILVIMITNTPYVSEWTFGGLSMAVAAAMGGIETRVVFIEQGVYAVCGNHEVSPDDRVFNVQEMLEATSDIPDLHFAVFADALRERGLERAESLSFVEPVNIPGLSALLGIRAQGEDTRPVRTIFF